MKSNTEGKVTELTAFGTMKGDCQTLTLSGPIERIRASYAQTSGSVTSLKLYRSGLAKTYGTLLANYEEWNFSESSILLGLHGYILDDQIK